MFCHVDWLGGVVEFDDLDLRLDIPLNEQIWSLKQDLLQVSYLAGKYVIDVGWYPDFALDGRFKAVVIVDANWQEPLHEVQCKSPEELEGALAACVTVVQKAIVGGD